MRFYFKCFKYKVFKIKIRLKSNGHVSEEKIYLFWGHLMIKKAITAVIPLTMLLLLFQNCGNQFQGNPGFQSLNSTDGSDPLQNDSDNVTDGTKT